MQTLLRRLTDVVMGRFAAYRIAQLDHGSPANIQEQTLLRLVRHARRTALRHRSRFRQHSHRGRLSAAGAVAYLRIVLDGVLARSLSLLGRCDLAWSHPVLRLVVRHNQRGHQIHSLIAANARLESESGADSAIAFLAAHPGTPLFTGRLFFLGGSTDLHNLADDKVPPRGPILAGDLSGISVREASPLLRPFTFPSEKLALVNDWDEKMRLLAERSVKLPITMLSGIPSWLLVLFERLRQRTGCERIADIWPALRLVIHGGIKFEPYRSLFRSLIGTDSVHFLETYPASEGFLATEDPRYELLRLLPDHNLFFEFVPIEEIDAPQPTRHTVADLQTGVQYAIVLTTCAGLWSYILGDTICFERRHPPLLRFTGRTRYFLSAFGEHVINEEVEAAVAAAAHATGTAVVDFHVGPQFSTSPDRPGRHRWFIEFAETLSPEVLKCFARQLDESLSRQNEDYRATSGGKPGPGGAASPCGAARRLRRLDAEPRPARRTEQSAAHGQQRANNRPACSLFPNRRITRSSSFDSTVLLVMMKR